MKFESIKDAKFAPFKKSLVENPNSIFGGKVQTNNRDGQAIDNYDTSSTGTVGNWDGWHSCNDTPGAAEDRGQY